MVWTSIALNASAPSASRPDLRSLDAARVTSSITVDGRFDEPDWTSAAAATGFAQFEPREGEAASQKTEVRVLYGDANLYVGATLHDEDPSSIEDALGRRDDTNRADWFFVSIDSYFDRTAYVFGVNAAGGQYDAVKVEGGPFCQVGSQHPSPPRLVNLSWFFRDERCAWPRRVRRYP